MFVTNIKLFIKWRTCSIYFKARLVIMTYYMADWTKATQIKLHPTQKYS